MSDQEKPSANTLYPLKPNYKGKTKGFFAWLHHDHILEWSHNVRERTVYVQENKPNDEMKTRAEHMIAIPDELIPKYSVEALQKWKEAHHKWDEALQKREEADQKWKEARQKWKEALQKLEKADQKWDEADQKREEADQKREEARHKWDEALQKREEARHKWDEALQKREEADQKFSHNPKLRKFLKANTPYSWDETNQTLIYE